MFNKEKRSNAFAYVIGGLKIIPTFKTYIHIDKKRKALKKTILGASEVSFTELYEFFALTVILEKLALQMVFGYVFYMMIAFALVIFLFAG